MPLHLPPVIVERVFTAAEAAEQHDWSLPAYDIPLIWDRGVTGKGVRVAVLDTGIDTKHPDLKDAIADYQDFTGSRYGIEDRNGHGTHCAGTIAAQRNGFGVAGVAHGARLLIAKVLGDDGSGSDSSIANGIRWAIRTGANVISMSLGSPQDSPVIAAAILEAVAAGIHVIVAAGNEGNQGVGFPGRMPDVVCTAAVDANGLVASFSSRGKQLDIAGPGVQILSTYPVGAYAKLSGTSMATPFVAAVVALALSAGAKFASNLELLKRLAETSTDAGPTGPDSSYGAGRINPLKFIGAPALFPSPPVPVPTPDPGDTWINLGDGWTAPDGRVGAIVFMPRK